MLDVYPRLVIMIFFFDKFYEKIFMNINLIGGLMFSLPLKDGTMWIKSLL